MQHVCDLHDNSLANGDALVTGTCVKTHTRPAALIAARAEPQKDEVRMDASS